MTAARAALALGLALASVLGGFALVDGAWPTPWSEDQRAALRSLWIGSMPAVPRDPSNRFADDPRAARLGARLFRDPRLSANGRVACSLCHQPERAFADRRAVARGLADGTRNTPSVVAAAHGPLYFWDGRRDSQWAQALAPLENSREMGSTRVAVVAVVAEHYRAEYEAVFGSLPETPFERDVEALDRAFANVGKSLASYQRTLVFAPSRFDRYVSHVLRGNHLRASMLLSHEEREGLALFLGRANCTLCHRGPLFTGHEFFSLGLPFGAAGPDPGRAEAARLLRDDPFNCVGRYSDAEEGECSELRFLSDDRLGFLANFKTPSLRNVAATAPYMHAGQFATLDEVVDHYNRAPRVPFPEHTDIQPLNLSAENGARLVAFLETLTSEIVDPYAPERPVHMISGD